MSDQITKTSSGDQTTATADRAQGILLAARKAFAAKGFDGASMQDLARSAGMSAGNFYRYFASKDAIIEAIVADELQKIESVFADIMASDDPKASYMRALAMQMDLHMLDEDGAIWTEIEAAAQRRPSIGEVHQRMLDTVIEYQLRVFARISGVTPEEARRLFAAHAAMVLLVVQGTAVGNCARRASVYPEDKRALRDLVLRTIDAVVAEIAAYREMKT